MGLFGIDGDGALPIVGGFAASVGLQYEQALVDTCINVTPPSRRSRDKTAPLMRRESYGGIFLSRP